ncbi:MAG: hypothetical protein ACE366_11780 [Bradymonadia bacterium]
MLEQLTDGDTERERACIIETPLDLLKDSGEATGLTQYLNELRTRLVPLISGRPQAQ